MRMERLISRFNIVFIWMIAFQAGCSPQKHAMETNKAVTILGLGDSITEGGPDYYSYLFPLDSLLSAAGQPHDFIGPRSSTREGRLLHHAGFSGKTAEFLAKQIDSIYSAYPADIVLLHAGHNHFQEENPVAGIVRAQKAIIETIRKRNRNARILVAGVITSGKLPKYAYIPELNIAIKAMVGSFSDPGIRFVDHQKSWNWTGDTIEDKVHPNKTGAVVIASQWFDALKDFLNKKQ